MTPFERDLARLIDRYRREHGVRYDDVLCALLAQAQSLTKQRADLFQEGPPWPPPI